MNRLKPFPKILNSLLRRSDSRIFGNNANPRSPRSFDPPAELPSQTPPPRLTVNSVKDGCGRGSVLSWVGGGVWPLDFIGTTPHPEHRRIQIQVNRVTHRRCNTPSVPNGVGARGRAFGLRNSEIAFPRTVRMGMRPA